MQSKYGPGRDYFRCFSAMKKYDGDWIGKISCHRVLQECITDYGGHKEREKQNASLENKCIKDGSIHPRKSSFLSCGKQSEEVIIQKCRKKYVILELQGEEFMLSIMLLHPGKSRRSLRTGEMAKRLQAAEWMDLGRTEIDRHVFTAEEILHFVTSIQDTNEIHRTVDPVVPGFQMMEWLLAVLGTNDWRALEIRFHAPALAGQELCLCPCTEGYQCILAETGELLWDCRVEQAEEKNYDDK